MPTDLPAVGSVRPLTLEALEGVGWKRLPPTEFCAECAICVLPPEEDGGFSYTLRWNADSGEMWAGAESAYDCAAIPLATPESLVDVLRAMRVFNVPWKGGKCA